MHLDRAALCYVSPTDSRVVAADLKSIYRAATAREAEEALERSSQSLHEKYPTIAKQWRLKWQDLITLFEFPPEIRHVIYTTNAIESVNSSIRKFCTGPCNWSFGRGAGDDRLGKCGPAISAEDIWPISGDIPYEFRLIER